MIPGTVINQNQPEITALLEEFLSLANASGLGAHFSLHFVEKEGEK